MKAGTPLEEPSLDAWIAEAKRDADADLCGMYLFHNGVVRQTSKAQVRQGVQGSPPVAHLVFSYDAAGVTRAEADARAMPGIFYVRTWLAEGKRHVGDSLMFVLIGGDTRPHVLDCLETLVETIKSKLVTEREVYVE